MLINGGEIRRYRKLIGWTQAAFAERFGISQAALSLIERGRIPVSEEHIARLTEGFDRPEVEVSFHAFMKDMGTEKASAQAALVSQPGRYLTLAVWKWEDGYDLSQKLTPDRSVGVITVRTSDNQAIAFEMGKDTSAWRKGEILVFEVCRPEEIVGGELCLVQTRRQRSGATQTLIAVTRVTRPAQGRTLEFQPVTPPAPAIASDKVALLAILRLVFRGVYTHEVASP